MWAECEDRPAPAAQHLGSHAAQKESPGVTMLAQYVVRVTRLSDLAVPVCPGAWTGGGLRVRTTRPPSSGEWKEKLLSALCLGQAGSSRGGQNGRLR